MYDIIVFAHLYKPHIGGLEKYVENFYKNLPSKKTLIITSRYDKNMPSISDDGILDILRIECLEIIKGKYYIPTFKGLKQIRNVIQENLSRKPEIHTHTRFYLTNYIATVLAKRNNLKHYHFEHGSSFVKDGSIFVRTFAWLFDKTFARYILKHSAIVFPVSESVKKFLETNFRNLKYGSTTYNSYQFTLKEFPQKEKPDTLKLLFVGRMIRSKGVYELVEACKLINEHGIPYMLTMIGDGSEIEEIKSLVEEYKLQNNVHILGQLSFDDTQAEYSNHDILVNPSYTEGLPTTVLEALAHGLMVIASSAGGTGEIIPQEKLIPLNNISGKSIRDKVIQVYKNWENEIKDYAKIYTNTKNKFNWKENVQKYEKLAAA